MMPAHRVSPARRKTPFAASFRLRSPAPDTDNAVSNENGGTVAAVLMLHISSKPAIDP
jgi:hypothetical protein